MYLLLLHSMQYILLFRSISKPFYCKTYFCEEKWTKLLLYVHRIDQFQYIKIQPKTTDLSMRLWVITTEAEF